MGLSLLPPKAFRSRTLSAFSRKTFSKTRTHSTADHHFSTARFGHSKPPSPVLAPASPPDIPEPPEPPEPEPPARPTPAVRSPFAARPGRAARAARTARRPPRLKDVDAPNLLRYLETFSFATVASSDTVNQLTDRLSSDVALLTHLVDILCHPTNMFDVGDEAARDRVTSAWIVSCLLRYGGNPVKDALAKQPSLLRRMAQVFVEAKPGTLDAAHVECILTIVRSQLQTHPKLTVSALPLRESFVPALVKHVDLQPVVEFLPRLVGTRAFPSRGRATALLPAHKRAITALAATKVTDRLADTFVKVSADVMDADSNASSSSADGLLPLAHNHTNHDTKHRRSSVVRASTASPTSTTPKDLKRDTIHAVCETMAEIAARATCLYLKPEDPDERLDGVFSSNGLGIVTASVFNDAKKYLDPFYTPAPFVRVLEKAVSDFEFLDDENDVTDDCCDKEHDKNALILLPPLNMFLHILRTWRETDPAYRTSLLVSEQPDVSVLGHALAPLWPRLGNVLRRVTNKNAQPSLIQLAVIDLLHDAAAVFDDADNRRALFAPDVTRRVVHGLKLFRANDIYVTSASHFLAHLVGLSDDHVPQYGTQVASIRTAVHDDLDGNYAASPLTDALKQQRARMRQQRPFDKYDDDDDDDDDDDPADSGEWQALCLVARRHRESGPVLRRRKSESELACAGEDLPHELYVMTHLELAKSSGIHTTPPCDDFVGQAVDAGVTQRSRGQLTMMQV